MPLYRGSTEQSALYRGGSDIAKVYRGNTEVWAAAGGGTLYIADNTGSELWSCAPDAPSSATLVGTFPSGLILPTGLTAYDWR